MFKIKEHIDAFIFASLTTLLGSYLALYENNNIAIYMMIIIGILGLPWNIFIFIIIALLSELSEPFLPSTASRQNWDAAMIYLYVINGIATYFNFILIKKLGKFLHLRGRSKKIGSDSN